MGSYIVIPEYCKCRVQVSAIDLRLNQSKAALLAAVFLVSLDRTIIWLAEAGWRRGSMRSDDERRSQLNEMRQECLHEYY